MPAPVEITRILPGKAALLDRVAPDVSTSRCPQRLAAQVAESGRPMRVAIVGAVVVHLYALSIARSRTLHGQKAE